MPVVNRDLERALVQKAQARGMNPDQIKQAVIAYRQQLGGSPQVASINTPTPPDQHKQGPIQGFVQGIAHTPLSFVTGGLNAVEGFGDLAGAGVESLFGNKQASQELVNRAGQAATKERDFGYFGKARPTVVNDQGQVMNTGNATKSIIGQGLELGSYLAPVEGVAGGTAKALLPRIAEQAGFGALGGSLGGAGSELQKKDSTLGSVLGAGLKGGLTGGLVGGALPAAGAVARGVTNLGGRVGAEVLGRTTGAGEAAIKEAFNNPNVVKFARQAGKEGPEALMTQALEDAQKGLKMLKKNRSGEYVSQLEKVTADKSQLDHIIGKARATARDWLESSGVKIKEGKLLNTLDFGESTIERGQGTVQKAFNDVMKWTDVTPAGLDKLQKKLSQHLDEIPVTERGGAFNFVLNLKNAVTDSLKDEVKGYQQMTSKYHEASDLIDEIQRALSLKDTAAKDTAVRKLMSTMRQNNELRKEMLDVLGKTSGADITGKIAGATLAARTPRGIQGAITPTSVGLGAISGILHAANIPYLLLYLASTSPRSVAEFVSLLSRVRGKVISPEIQTAMKKIIRQATVEAASSGEASK